MSYQIKIPSYICGGEGCIENVAAIIEKEHAKKIIVFTDKGIRLTGLLDILTKILHKTTAEYQVFDNLTPEPAYQDVERVRMRSRATMVILLLRLAAEALWMRQSSAVY